MDRITRTYKTFGMKRVVSAFLRALACIVDPPRPVSGTVAACGHIDFIRAAVPGFMQEGNVVGFDYAISYLPSDDPVLEIGSFGGLSACVMSYLLRKHEKPNPIWCIDPWKWEGFDDGDTQILPSIPHRKYMEFIYRNFIRNVDFFSDGRIFHQKIESDDFFARFIEKPLSFAYVDGDHRYEQAKRDFLNVDRWLVPDGFILFDDTADEGNFGCVKLMPDVKATGRYELVMKNPNYLWKKLR